MKRFALYCSLLLLSVQFVWADRAPSLLDFTAVDIGSGEAFQLADRVFTVPQPSLVLFFEPKRIYNGPFYGHDGAGPRPASWTKHPLGEVPESHYSVPLGEAKVVRPGNKVTVVSYGTMVHVAEAAIDKSGVDAELIDLRTLLPLDTETIVSSVEKTGRCIVVHEATRTSGFGAELVTQVQEECFWHLRAPIERVTGWDTPYPHAFEWEYFPSVDRIATALSNAAAIN